jgi:glucose-6-phosphate isomerase
MSTTELTAVAGSILGIHPFDQPDVEGRPALRAHIVADVATGVNTLRAGFLAA